MDGLTPDRRRGRQTTDQVPAVDIRSMKRAGLIAPGQKRIGGGPNNLPGIDLEWTSCNYGGSRPWFICPGEGCGRRVAILYGPTLPPLCRQCRGLCYASQRPEQADGREARAGSSRRT